MSLASLTARYRPQTFADVTGQDTVKKILSRAVAEDKVAPAYLFSGTRGVGKTTIARIFAKALNCRNAVDGEPCNACPSCKAITAGHFVDVVEIDGASNNKVDDARNLRENIGFAPMEGRYKVFIIDEAHMLTTQAFNALLKTLEEPPARVTFIMATTEAHKFLPTIVSRCQCFTFKALPEPDIAGHLSRILAREGIPAEDGAVRLLARRAAGSVRDAMSLLGQTLALGGDALTESVTRSVLGLAGMEMYERLLTAIRTGRCLDVVGVAGELLSSGADIGDFLRELAALWRNMFLVKQAGDAAFGSMDLPEADKRRLAALAADLPATTVHAAWQMTLDGQRQVLNSLEPGAALELLLLNMALLPKLTRLDFLSQPLAERNRDVDRTRPAAHDATPEPTGSARPRPPVAPTRAAAPSWAGFLAFADARTSDEGALRPAHLRQVTGAFTDDAVRIEPSDPGIAGTLAAPAPLAELTRLVQEYAGKPLAVSFQEAKPTAGGPRRRTEPPDASVQLLEDAFDAKLIRRLPADADEPGRPRPRGRRTQDQDNQ